MNKDNPERKLLKEFLRNPSWVRFLHDMDCLPTYDECDPTTCSCDGVKMEKIARNLFPVLHTKEFLGLDD